MKTKSPYFAATATFLLHAALVVTVVTGLSVSQPKLTPPEPLMVRLLPPAPPVPLPVAVQAPPPAIEKKRPEPKPRPERRQVAPVRETPTQQLPAQETASESKPAPSAAAPVQAAPATAPAPAAAPPVKTSASNAAYASTNRKPPYPRLSRINEEQGTVVLRVLVKADGTAGTVEIKNSSSYPLLDESAKNTVLSWRFKPATVDGKPVTEWYQLAIPFTLQEN